MRAAGRFLSRTRTPNVSQTLPGCVLNSGLCHRKRRWNQSPARLLMKIFSNLKVHHFCTVLIYCSDTLQLHLFPYLHDWRESAQLTHHWQGLTFCDQDVIFLIKFECVGQPAWPLCALHAFNLISSCSRPGSFLRSCITKPQSSNWLG